MADLARQLVEDRLLRDAARTLVEADIQHVKRAVVPANPKADLGSRARDIADDARAFAGEHRIGLGAVVALLLASIAAWIFREQLVDAVRAMLEDNAEPAGDGVRSPNEPEPSAETDL